jgi:hypothetical protein
MTDEATPPAPMITLEPGGVAPVLSYNVPEPTTYSGRNFIDLQFPASYFVVGTSSAGDVEAADDYAAALAQSDADGALGIAPRGRNGSAADDAGTASAASGDDDLVAALAVDPVEAAVMRAAGRRLQPYRSMSGALAHTWVPSRVAPQAADDPGARAVALALPNGETEPVEIEAFIASPADDSTVSGPHTGASVTVTGSVWSNRTIGGVSVRIGVGSFVAATMSGSNFSFSTTLTAPGPTLITARARTSTGIIHDATITVNVALAPPPDTVPPAVSITAPTQSATISGPTSPVALTVTGTSGDPGGIRQVDVSVDGGAFAAATPRAAGDWSTWTRAVSLAAGSHSVTARAADMAGNLSQQTVTFSVSITPPPDATGPAVSITSPTAGSTVQGPYSGATVTVRGTASDPSGVALVALKLDASPVLVDAQPSAPGNWSTWTGTLVVQNPGAHIVTARCVDGAGNATEVSISISVTLVPDVVNRLNRFIIVESYRLSSFLGSYGAGRTLKTFSLLPGEKTKLSIKTYTRTETDAKEASNILDSFSEESSADFEESMADEQSNKKNYDETWNYKVGIEAKASWGWGSASARAETSGGTNSAREDFAKNISTAVQKHVSKASAKREVQVNTSYEVKTQTGEETSLEREIANINVGATLNFVFRQMNQEFITLLHLVDVRVGYFKVDTVNGVERYTYREATLPELDNLIRDVIVEARRVEVRNVLLHQLTNVFDYKDRHHVLVEDEPLKDRNGRIVPLSNYLRWRKGYTSTHVDEATGTQITVPGVILAAQTHVLRTEGIIVEALLGQGDGLDEYSHGLQEQAVRAKALENDAIELEQDVSRLALRIVQTNDTEMAALYERLFLNRPAGG